VRRHRGVTAASSPRHGTVDTQIRRARLPHRRCATRRVRLLAGAPVMTGVAHTGLLVPSRSGVGRLPSSGGRPSDAVLWSVTLVTGQACACWLAMASSVPLEPRADAVDRGPAGGAPGRDRTCDQVLRRHLLYPLSYGRSGSDHRTPAVQVGSARRGRRRHVGSGAAGQDGPGRPVHRAPDRPQIDAHASWPVDPAPGSSVHRQCAGPVTSTDGPGGTP
jgi:hypothetical protein